MRNKATAVRKPGFFLLFLVLGGLVTGCGGFNGSVPISPWMFVQSAPTGEPSQPPELPVEPLETASVAR